LIAKIRLVACTARLSRIIFYPFYPFYHFILHPSSFILSHNIASGSEEIIMPRCPVCHTKYVASQTENCSLCGWNLQPYALIIGLIPEVFFKEQARLEWARGLWGTVKPHREQIQQLQFKLKEAEQITTRLRLELQQANFERDKLLATLQQRESHQLYLQEQSLQVNQELNHLRLQLEQANLAREQLLTTLQQRESNQVYLQKQSEVANQELIQLREELKQANQAGEQLSATLHQQEITITQIQSQVNQIAEAQNQPTTVSEPSQNQPDQEDAPSISSPEENHRMQAPDFSLEDQEIYNIVESSDLRHQVSPPLSNTVLIDTATDVEKEPRLKLYPYPASTSGIKLLPLTFDVVIVDTQGEQTDCYTGEARYFKEDLGGVALEMVTLPGGNFWMGSKETEEGRESHEEPQHQVTIEPFCISRFPITQEQWRAIANLTSVDRSLNPDPSNLKGDNQPVEQVSWHDAQEFCARLAKISGRDYRLPSEAEWEYACRAGTTTPFHFGEAIAPNLANYDGNYTYGLAPLGEYRQRTVAIGSFPVANAFGLCDMHGNVWEWCADPWHDNYHQAPCDGNVWEAGGIQNHRLLRGGSWYCLPSLCRAAQRHWDQADHGGSGISFRVACSAVG
jgi:formylglycine-generating enzyme required for sulfatase activity